MDLISGEAPQELNIVPCINKAHTNFNGEIITNSYDRGIESATSTDTKFDLEDDEFP